MEVHINAGAVFHTRHLVSLITEDSFKRITQILQDNSCCSPRAGDTALPSVFGTTRYIGWQGCCCMAPMRALASSATDMVQSTLHNGCKADGCGTQLPHDHPVCVFTRSMAHNRPLHASTYGLHDISMIYTHSLPPSLLAVALKHWHTSLQETSQDHLGHAPMRSRRGQQAWPMHAKRGQRFQHLRSSRTVAWPET